MDSARVAVIAGGSRGIGLALVAALVSRFRFSARIRRNATLSWSRRFLPAAQK